jgi:hypothetical protein
MIPTSCPLTIEKHGKFNVIVESTSENDQHQEGINHTVYSTKTILPE